MCIDTLLSRDMTAAQAITAQTKNQNSLSSLQWI